MSTEEETVKELSKAYQLMQKNILLTEAGFNDLLQSVRAGASDHELLIKALDALELLCPEAGIRQRVLDAIAGRNI